MLGAIGPKEILLIILVLMVVFGSRRIPEFAHNLGSGLVEFKKALGKGWSKKTLSDSTSDSGETRISTIQDEKT